MLLLILMGDGRMSFDMVYTYFQLALLLGVSRRDIQQWVSDGKLQAATDGRYFRFTEASVINFLKSHPESVGRVYCNDLPIFLEERERIAEQISY